MVQQVGTEEQQLDIELDANKAVTLQNTAALLEQQNEERDTLNQIIGQIQMTDAIAKLTTVVGLSKLAHIKETRMYKALAGKKGVDRHGNEIADVGTWEGFCLAVGTTRQKADEDILNLRQFGEEALENLTRIGAGYRELRQFRKLPADQKQALIEIAKAGDKEGFVELAEEIISKHSKEKEQLSADLEEARADYDAQGQLLKKTRDELDQTKLALDKAKYRIIVQKPDDVEHQLRTETAAIAAEIDALFKNKLSSAAQSLMEHGNKTSTDQHSYLGTMISYLERQLEQLKEQYSLQDSLYDGEPSWMRPEALAEAESLVAQFNQEQ
jgi:hypothetical protein